MGQTERARRGQGSVEYLVLLAIALVLMLILIALLGGFGGTISATQLSEAQIYWESVARPFAILDWGQRGDTLYISLANNGYENLFLRQVIVENAVADLGAGWTYRVGRAKNMSIPGLPACSGTYDSYSYRVALVYDSYNIQGYVENGTKPILGYCS